MNRWLKLMGYRFVLRRFTYPSSVEPNGKPESPRGGSTRALAPCLETFIGYLRTPDRFWKNVLTREIVEDAPTTFAIKVTECLWARTFREVDADIGYACICHPDFASAAAFNPNMRLERTKTLMQGHDCCSHRWIVET